MAAEQSIEKVLVPWLKARDARLGGRVRPAAQTPGDAGPYCTHWRVSTRRFRHLKGPEAVTVARVQLDFWSQDAAEAQAVADKVAGTAADPGLDGFRGLMGTVAVQCSRRDDQGSDHEPPGDGTEQGWHRVRADYVITFEEGT